MKLILSIISWCKKNKYYIARGFPIVVIVLGFLMTEYGFLSTAYAQINTSTNEMAQTVSFLNSILKVIYIILRPLLVVAGMALDNSLVLGEVFHLDAALWKFWTIMTTFANFALGFVVLFHIVKYVLGFNDDTKPVFDIIKKALLAGVGIQVSRFAILALLDISSIAIYSIGAMPMQVMENTQLDDKVIMTMHSKMDFDKMNDANSSSTDSAFSVYYSCGAQYFGPCLVQSGYVVGPQSDFDDVEVDSAYCAMGGMYANQSLVKVPGNDGTCVSLRGDGTSGAPESCLSFKKMHEVTVSKDEATAMKCEGMSTLLGQSKGFVKVLVTMYASLLDFANINLTDEQLTTGGALVVFLLKLILALALIVPLLALAVVLLVRVAYLWLIISFAPLLVIKNIFFKDAKLLGNIKVAGAEMGDRFQDIIAAIFMPVVVVFALSLGMIFLKITIDAMNPADVGRSRLVQQEFGFERVEDDDLLIYQISPVEIGYRRPKESYALSMFLDFFSYMVVNLFAIGLLWVLFFAAMKSSKFLGEIGSKIDKTGRQVMGSLPVIPIPGGGKAGISTAFGTDYDSLLGRSTSKVLERNRRLNEEAVQKLFGEDTATKLEQDETENIAKRVLTNGSSILEAADQELGKRYDQASTMSYVSAVTPQLISMANASTDADQKYNALNELNNHITKAQNQTQIASAFNPWKSLSLAGATGETAWTRFAGADGKKEYIIGTGDNKQTFTMVRKDDGTIQLLDKSGNVVSSQPESSNLEKQELTDDAKVATLFDSLQSSNGQENLDQLAAKANGDIQGDYHTDDLRGLLATKTKLIQSDKAKMKQLGTTILKDINDANNKSETLQRWNADPTLKQAMGQALSERDKQQYGLGGAEVIKLDNYSGNEADPSARNVNLGRKDRYQENIAQTGDTKTRKQRSDQTSIADMNSAIKGKVGDRSGFFQQETITKNNETYTRSTTNQAFEKKTN